jgi:glutaredoxin
MKYFSVLLAAAIIIFSFYIKSTKELLVFTQKDCTQCDYAIKYLNDKNAKFTEYKTEDEANSRKMWDMIQKAGISDAQKVKMPVIVHGDDLYYNTENLEVILKKVTGK